MIIEYGDGKIWTQQCVVAETGVRCLTLTKMETAMPINSTPAQWKERTEAREHDVIIAFKNIEGARTLQDELNELISKWSKEQSPVVPFTHHNVTNP